MLYEIVNPSDKCTIEAPDDTVAGMAILLLGEGYYGAEDENGKDLPVLCVFGGEGALVGALNGIGVPAGASSKERIDAFMKARGREVAWALESIAYCSLSTRKALMAAFDGLPDRVERLAKYNDERRTSMNDIAARAYSLAKAFRAGEEVTP